MRIIRISALGAAVAIVGLASCSDSLSVAQRLASDSTISADVAISAGDALATSIESMVANEAASSLSGIGANQAAFSDKALSYSRTSTCFDAAGAVVANCNPLSSVRKVVTLVTIDGSRSGSSTNSGGTTSNWTGVVHRTSNDTLTRNFNTAQPPVELSRTHSDLTAGNDTTTFSQGDVSRNIAESTTDSIKAVTWNLPRSSNPFPVSGSIVRVVVVHVVVTKGNQTVTRDVTRKVQLDFPPDAQGNVVLKVDDKTCNLNLVTHVVSSCQ